MGRPRKNPINSASTKKILSLPGAFDISLQSDPLWEALVKRFAKFSRIYGFSSIETPFLEDSRLYENFYKNTANKATLSIKADLPAYLASSRPALLPSVLRAYYEHKVYDSAQLSKWSYSGFTANLAEKEKLNFDYQFGFEIFGNFTHLTEAQVISAVWEMAQSLELKDLSLEINSIGKPECQVAYQETLHDFLNAKKYELCDNCNEHLRGRVLNIFRCENLDCQALIAEAPTILEFLDEESHKHFTNILEALDELGIPYQLNHLYAGAEGHNKTNLVIKYKHKGQTTILGEGGYHEGLMQNLCGKNFCCFGFTGSLKQLYTHLESQKMVVAKEQRSDVFLVPLGELASKKSLRLFRDLIREKISVYDHFGMAGVKNQLKTAEAFNAPVALIMGQKEAVDEMVILRDVKSGMQEVISYDKIVEEVKKRLGK
jgi:histidyl-tRNA synthetase